MTSTPHTGTLTVVIVSYRTRDLLDDCLTSLRPEIGAGRECIVVDNASGDGSAEMVRERHPWVTLIASPENLGFGRGCNTAVSSSSADWILLLNPDTTATEGMIDAILGFADRHPDGGLYGGRTTDPGGLVDPRSCWGAPTLWSTACFALGLSTVFSGNSRLDPEAMGDWPRDTEREVGVITGCLMLVSREWWKRLDGFDERYFMYGEDVDFSLRARAAGARPMITPRATVMHVVGASSNRPDKLVYLLKGKITVARDHFGDLAGALARDLLILGAWLRGYAGPLILRRDGTGWSQVWRRRREWMFGY